jgi:hypothetical protein
MLLLSPLPLLGEGQGGIISVLKWDRVITRSQVFPKNPVQRYRNQQLFPNLL